MIIVCPNCEFKRDVTNAVIPSTATKATCPKCGVKFSFRDAIVEEGKDTQEQGIHENKENVSVDISKEAIDKSEHFKDDTTFRQNETSEASQRSAQKKDSANEEGDNPKPKLSEEEEELLRKAHEAYRKQLEKIENLKKQGYVLQALAMVPWESDSTDKNIFQKFFQTIVQVLFSAPAFFATMFRPFPIKKAVTFYIVVGFLQFLARYFGFIMTDTMSLSAEGVLTEDIINIMRDTSFMIQAFLIAPFMIFAQFTLFAVVLFSVVKLVQPQSADFNHIARIVAYASAPSILSIVPVIGDMLALPWMLFNLIVACRFGLHLSIGKTVLATAAFCLFCMVILNILFSFFFAGI